MNGWEQTVDRVPPAVWMALVIANLVVTAGTWSAARRRIRHAGQRAADPHLVAGRGKAKDTALTVASMIPAGLFWAMVLAGSLHGLVAFGRDSLGWHDGWEYLVPGTLDGVSVTFAFLAFRAVRKQKAPDRCNRVVWGAAIASATVNFAYEYSESSHNLIAGGYLALLSLFGMVMFHEFLAQFEDGAGYVKRDNPKFGLRWLTWPTNTFCAAVAWRNHPPTEATPATVPGALANLERIRALKRDAREEAIMQRHQRAITKARRRAELAAATTAPPAPDDRAGIPTTVNGHDPDTAMAPPAAVLPQADTASTTDDRASAASTTPGDPAGADVKVPATAATLTQWATTWIRMCGDGNLASGPLNDDQQARTRYQLSAKQLRNIRNAATTGTLRRKANQLGVPLPADYTDHPAVNRANGHRPTPTATR